LSPSSSSSSSVTMLELSDCGSSVSSCTTASNGSNKMRKPIPFSATKQKEQEELSMANEEESIQVVFRMRPLNDGNEAEHGRAWVALEDKSSIIETTSEGIPINSPLAGNNHDRIQVGRNIFGHDKTFGETATTRDVYNDVAQQIVTSAIAPGLNGTIFAYGQTSSGKTYTMQGDGLGGDDSDFAPTKPKSHMEKGPEGEGPPDEFNDEIDEYPDTVSEKDDSSKAEMEEGGIIHMAAKDIFDNIDDTPDRVFSVKVSYIEVYNEEVRDLLVMSSEDPLARSVLSVREDPQRGFFVPSKEQPVKDVHSMIDLLVQGNKSRAFAATAMNSCSSRSHTIFRVMVESRGRKKRSEMDSLRNDDEGIYSSANPENEIDEESAIRVATLNFVDLAGSESVRHTGATGDSLKEGCRINTSLSVLSRVIEALGTAELHPSKTILPPFRESKLTRILQPSLSGNARMVMICCGTPSALYKEKTRSTLHFAARAKLVKTNAKVNEVLDDKAMIRKLQKQLAHARLLMAKCDTKRMLRLEEDYNAASDKVYRLQGMLVALMFDAEHGRQSERQFPADDSFLDSRTVSAFTLTPTDSTFMLQALALQMTNNTSVTSSPVTSVSDMLRVALEQKADEVLLQQERLIELMQQKRQLDAELKLAKEQNSSMKRELKTVKKECSSLRGSEDRLKAKLQRNRDKHGEPFDAASDSSEGEASVIQESGSEDTNESDVSVAIQESKSEAEEKELESMEAEMWWSLENIQDEEDMPKRGAVPLLERCMVKYQWDKSFALRVLEAYKQFLTLQKEQEDTDGEVLIPIGPVKLMWNEHFLDVDNYVNDCILLCGHVVKHNDLDEEDLNSHSQHLHEKTRQALERLGFAYEDDLWSFENAPDTFDLFSPANGSTKDAFVGSFGEDDEHEQSESTKSTGVANESNRLPTTAASNAKEEPSVTISPIFSDDDDDGYENEDENVTPTGLALPPPRNPTPAHSFLDEDDAEAYF